MLSARLSKDLVEFLISCQVRVTVLCPRPSRPLGVNYSYEAIANDRGESNNPNLRVVSLPSYCSPRSRLFLRVWESISFGNAVCRYLREDSAGVGVVYANTWPLGSQALLARCCSAHGIPLVLHVQDLYPESLLLRLPRIFRFFLWGSLLALDSWIARRASKVILISSRSAMYYSASRRIPREKFVSIENWVDERMYEQLPKRSAACDYYGIEEGRRTFMFLGNLGPLAEVDRIIRAFSVARPENSQLVIAGDGVRKGEYHILAQRLEVPNVYFISDAKVENTPRLLAMADVCLLPLKRGAGLGSVPSKLLSYLFSGKPVLATIDQDSDTAGFIKEAGCGWIGSPDDEVWLAQTIRTLAGLDQGELTRLGAAGRSFGLARFSRAAGVPKLAAVILAELPTHRGDLSGSMEGRKSTGLR